MAGMNREQIAGLLEAMEQEPAAELWAVMKQRPSDG